jgi:hypothetical protein
MTKLMELNQPFRWTPQVGSAFQTLKEALHTASNLAYPQPREGFVVDTDAGPSGLEEYCPDYRTNRRE